MAIAIEATAQGAGGDLSFNCPAGTTLLLVLYSKGRATATLASLDYNGTAMTKKISVNTGGAPNDAMAEIWYLVNPDTGAAHDINSPIADATTVYDQLIAVALSGTSVAADPFRDAVSQAGDMDADGGAISQSIDTVAGDLVIDILGCYRSGANTKGADQTVIYTGDYYGASYQLADAVSETLEWTGTSTSANGYGWCMVSVIRPLTNFDDWTETSPGTGLIELETTDVVAGTNSAKLTNGIGAGNVATLSQTLTVYDGRSYVLEGLVKGDWQIDIESGGNSDTDSGTAAAWSQESVTCVADGDSLTVTLQPDGDSDVVYFDAFTLQETAPIGYEYTNFIGTLVDISPSSGQFDNPVTRCTAHDWIGYLNKQEIGLQALQSDKRVDEVLTTLLAEFPNQPEGTDFDSGVETFEVVFASDSSESSMARIFAKLARNERGRIYSRGDGTLVFEKQGTRDGSQDPAFTIDGTMTEFDVDYTANNIYNIVSLDIKTQLIDAAADKQLFNVGQGVPIAAGETITLECNFTDEDTGQAIAGVDVVTPVASPHFGSTRTPAAEDLNANLDDTNYQVGATSLTVDLENTGGVLGYLNEFIILGKRLTDYDRITITRRNDASINQVGNKKYTNDLDLIEDPNRAVEIADDILDHYAPSHTAGTRLELLANLSDSLAAALIASEVSTLFSAVESVTGISKDFYIDNIRYVQDHTLLWVIIEAEEA